MFLGLQGTAGQSLSADHSCVLMWRSRAASKHERAGEFANNKNMKALLPSPQDPKSYRHLRHVQRQQEAAAMAAAAAAAAASESKQAEPKLQQGGISSNANPSPMSSALHDAKAATTNSEEASPCSLTMFKEVCVLTDSP
eukprot:1155462-Pelagomonas_calceolata.AAC.1